MLPWCALAAGVDTEGEHMTVVAQRCEPGSADPHGLGEDDTHVARATLDRARAFSMDAHVEASAAELMGRAFVSMNVASKTEAVPAAERVGPGREPPRVTRFEQLSPSAASVKLARWRRQFIIDAPTSRHCRTYTQYHSNKLLGLGLVVCPGRGALNWVERKHTSSTPLSIVAEHTRIRTPAPSSIASSSR